MTRTSSTQLGHGDLGASIVLMFPLLIAYQLGVPFAGTVNGADVVTRALYALVGSRGAYLLVHACIAGIFVLWIRHHRRWGALRLEVVMPLVLEAAIYALTLGAAITMILDRLVGLGAADSIVSALGAGVHEELVFRLGLFGGAVLLLRGSPGERWGVPCVLVATSLLFAAAHHAGRNGEVFTAHAFAFRTLAGIAFGAMFWFRSFAHAVYAHVLYDLVVAAS